MNISRILALLSLAIIIFSCDEKVSSERIKEGFIDYQIEYIDDTLQNMMFKFLPKKMTVKFKNNNTLNKIESISGIVSFTHVQNCKNNTNTTLVKVMGKKYKYIEKLDEPSMFFQDIPGIFIEETGETKEIAGYLCKKATIKSSDPNIKPFYVFYTNEIQINDPNRHTPFKSIDGVLLEFQVKIYDINMRVTSTHVRRGKISDKEFEITKDYERINRKTMEEIIALVK